MCSGEKTPGPGNTRSGFPFFSSFLLYFFPFSSFPFFGDGDPSFQHVYSLERSSSRGCRLAAYHCVKQNRSFPIGQKLLLTFGPASFKSAILPSAFSPFLLPQGLSLCSPDPLFRCSSSSVNTHKMSSCPLTVFTITHEPTSARHTLQSPALPKDSGLYTQMPKLSLPPNMSKG